MKKASQQDELALSVDHLERLYRRFLQGALVRAGASTVMWLFALISYLMNETQINHFTGVSLSVLFLIAINPPTLLILKRSKSKRAFKYVSILINILEIIGYTAIIYSLGGVEATFLTPIYAALIVYAGVLGPRNYSYFIASICSVAFGLMVAGEYFDLLPPQHVVASFNAPWLTIITRLSVVIGLLFVVAYITALTSNILNKNKKKLRVQNLDLLAKTASLEKAENGLRASHQELEKRIEERTHELRVLNDRLIVDITERKQAEASLQDSEEKFRNIAESSLVGIYIIQDGVFTYINPTLADIFGYSVEDCLNHMHFSQLVHPEDFDTVEEQVFKQERGEAKSVNYTFRGVNKNGKVIDVETFGSSISLRGRTSVTGTMLDITERKELEKQLQQSQKMEAIGTLAGGIAHDFNNILAVVIGYGELAMDKAHKGIDNTDDVGHIVKAAERASDLVQQILTFSRRSEVDLKPLDLNQRVTHNVKMLEHTIPKMIDIQMKLAGNLDCILADATQLEQVLMNLANNAADAMPEGGRLVFETSSVEVDPELAKQYLGTAPGRYVLLSITDTGQGMDKETISQIFNPFFTTKEVGKGTGLGLSTAYGIIQEHGGRITCYSEPGQGTTFNIYLPANQTGQEVSDEQALQEAGAPGGNETLLLVDDEAALRELGTQILQTAGYKVIKAASGEEALASYQQGPAEVDLVILDLGMPGMGGHKCLKELSSMNPAMKVLIASGYSAEGKVKDTVEQGAAGYIAKPFKRHDLLNLVRSVLDA